MQSDDIMSADKKITLLSHTYAFGDFYCYKIRGNIHVCLGCTKMWSPRISTVVHCNIPNVHILCTNPFLTKTQLFSESQNCKVEMRCGRAHVIGREINV